MPKDWTECRDRRIARALQAAALDLGRRMSRNDCARVAHLEPAYFSKRFRIVVRTSYTEWSRQYRAQRAKELLATSDMPIAQIANALGFDDVTTFTRNFKRYVGKTPRDFRRDFSLCARWVGEGEDSLPER
jgi:AraC-like DNA-binding protein